MKNLLALAILFFSCSQKEQDKKENSTTSMIVLNFMHYKYPKQIIVNIKEKYVIYRNSSLLIPASSNPENHPSENKLLILDDTSIMKIIQLFDAIKEFKLERNTYGDGMLTAIEAYTNDGKIIELHQMNDRHQDEIDFIESVLGIVESKSADLKVKKEAKVLMEAL